MVYRLQTRTINSLKPQLCPGVVKTHEAWVMGYHDHQHMKWGTPSRSRQKDYVNIQYVYHGFSKPLGAIRLTKNYSTCSWSLTLILVNDKT